jgi:haloalkane dehalogenase
VVRSRGEETWRREFFPSRWLNVPSLPELENKIHYVDEGQGEVVLCVHGNPTWSFYYRSVIARLRSKYRVIAYDHFGCGLSSRPRNFGYTLAAHVAVCKAVVAALGLERVHLVVHDWGGPIGLGWAVDNPDMLHSVVVLNSAAFMEDDVPRRINFLRLPYFGEFLMRRLNLFARAAVYMATAKGLNAVQRGGLLFPYGDYDSRLGIARFVQDIPVNSRHPTFKVLKTIAGKLAGLKCPVQVLWGMKDFCFHPGFITGWREAFPQAQVLEFPEAGHYLLEDEAERVPREIERFLGDV